MKLCKAWPCEPIYMHFEFSNICKRHHVPFEISTSTFDDLLNERHDALQNIKNGYDKTFWREVIDDINELLNRIRINETPLRPAIFARSSYPAP